MKAKYFKKIRLQLKDEKFLLTQLKKWAKLEGELEHFYKFKCSEFFEGKTMAEINLKEYYKKRELYCHKIDKFKRLLENVLAN